MHSRRWVTCGSIFVLTLLLVAALPVYLYNRPLGPSLDLIRPAAAAAGHNPVSSTLQKSTSTPQAAAVPAAQKGICGQTGKVNMLMLGQNLPGSAPRGADVIRLMVVDYDAPSVAILSMPPDLWVQTTALKDKDIEATRLTMAFEYGEAPPPQGEPAKVRKATQVVAQALLDNFGYETQKYLTLDQPEFKDMVDTLEGVEVNVLEYADGTPEGYGIYEPGLQLMSGQQALDYIRMTQPAGHPPDEWSRFSQQNQVIKGIQSDILKPENWIRIPALVKDFYHLLVTDLSPNELRDLNCMIAKVGDNVTVLEVAPDMVIIQRNGVMIPNVEAINQLIDTLQNGS